MDGSIPLANPLDTRQPVSIIESARIINSALGEVSWFQSHAPSFNHVVASGSGDPGGILRNAAPLFELQIREVVGKVAPEYDLTKADLDDLVKQLNQSTSKKRLQEMKMQAFPLSFDELKTAREIRNHYIHLKPELRSAHGDCQVFLTQFARVALWSRPLWTTPLPSASRDASPGALAEERAPAAPQVPVETPAPASKPQASDRSPSPSSSISLERRLRLLAAAGLIVWLAYSQGWLAPVEAWLMPRSGNTLPGPLRTGGFPHTTQLPPRFVPAGQPR